MIPPNLYRDVPVAVDYAPYIMGALYLVAWFVREKQFGDERERLLDRLMSKDVREFKAITKKEVVLPQSWGQLDDEVLADLETKRRAAMMDGD